MEIIEAHRAVAEPERVGKPVYLEELAVVDAALTAAALPPAERVVRAREVSVLAMRDARQKGQARATLRYAFGLGWFAERLARAREQRETEHRRRQDEVLASALFRPLAKTRGRRQQAHDDAPAYGPMSAEELERHLAAMKAACAC